MSIRGKKERKEEVASLLDRDMRYRFRLYVSKMYRT